MLETTIAGSLPKPAWLAETNKLWPAWRASGDELAQAKRDATLLWLKEQEDASNRGSTSCTASSSRSRASTSSTR